MKKTGLLLFKSIISLILCISMLAGTTFAWFTDSVTSGSNIIQSGRLDAGLYWSETLETESLWKDASEGAIFDYNYWEPGYTDLKYLKITNEGNLAFQYQLTFGLPGSGSTDAGKLAEVIDVYYAQVSDPIPDRETAEAALQRVGTLADLLDRQLAVTQGTLLPESGTATGAVTACVMLKMREDAGNAYMGLTAGNGFCVRLLATQYTWENDSFGPDYDLDASFAESIVATRQVRLLPNVVKDLPEEALAVAPGVSFGNSPYAYTDTSLFSGRHITRIGIPVKSVKALDNSQTFTLSVVKTTSAARAASDTYQYVSQNVLTLPREQLGDFTTVNKWIYVDVDLQLAADETLAFGHPDDTVEWGYSRTNNSPYNFRSASGSWSQVIKESILFDVYATETLEFKETEHGLAVVTESRVFPNVLTDFPESAIASGNPVEFGSHPYSYVNQNLFAGKRITRIGIPVKTVSALDENQKFQLSVIKTGSGAYQTVSTHEIPLPLDQLGDSTTVNKWIYVDVDLQLAEDETLAFGGADQSVIWAWKRGFSDTAYQFRDKNGGKTTGIFFDIYTETVLTYEDYQKQLKEEQERLEAEQEQARLDAQLKEKLAGKGISILGDSISTFQGWSNNTAYNSTIGSNYVYYTGSRDGFASVSETWWMQTITRSGLDLVVNNSWSGDEVTGRGVSRAKQLHNNAGREPDIIAVYLGINDFRRGKSEDTFRAKYEEMVSGMLEKYPNKDVYLFTLLYTTNMESSVYAPAEVTKYNAIIKEIAEKYGCTLVDIYTGTGITPENLATYMGDKNLHPNYAGMDLITQCFLDALREKYL